MFDIPRFEECGNPLHERRHHCIFSGDHPSEIVRDGSLDQQPQVIGFFDFVAEFDDRQEGLTGNAAPIQADAAECVGFNNSDTSAKLSRPDRGDIATGSSTENGDVSLN